MAVKNLMEDIVTALVDEVLLKTSKDNNDSDRVYRDDIITYVLNRIPPRYYTSERGMLHGKIDSQFVFQQKTDILLLTHEAINTIKKRRSSELKTAQEEKAREYFLPHILGEILEETTFSIIPSVAVTLLYEKKPAEMIDDSWKNPYITNKATKGFFHFWPKLPDSGTENRSRGNKIQFELVCTHPKFLERRTEFILEIVENRNSYKSYIMPMVLMQKLEGVDLTFLSE
ncbi:MAG: late competence development ComFB family protein [Spirochaetota bacterium]